MNDGVMIGKKRGNNKCGGGMKGKEGKGDFLSRLVEREGKRTRDRRQGRAIDWRLDRQMDDQIRERGESLSLIIVVVGKELGDGKVGIEAESCLVSKSVA